MTTKTDAVEPTGRDAATSPATSREGHDAIPAAGAISLARWCDRLFWLAAAIAATLSAWSATQFGPSYDEGGHAASAIYHWDTGRFDAYCVNPPLPRLLQGLAVLPLTVDTSLIPEQTIAAVRREWPLARTYLADRGEAALGDIARMRWIQIPLYLLGAVGVRRIVTMVVVSRGGLATDLPGPSSEPGRLAVAKLAAGVLYLFDPNILAAVCLVTPDISATVAGIWATVIVMTYVQEPTLERAAFVGLGVGLALMCKFTWALVVPIWGAWCLWSAFGASHLKRQTALETDAKAEPVPPRSAVESSGDGPVIDSNPDVRLSCDDTADGPVRSVVRAFGHASLAAGVAWFVVCSVYGFEQVGTPLSEFRFSSESGTSDSFRALQTGSWGWLPVPLPRRMVEGLDTQKADFDRGFPCFIFGEHQYGGDWRFYLVAGLVKSPLAWLPLYVWGVAAGGVASFSAGRSRLIAVPLTVGMAVLVGVSMNTGFTHHFRYAAVGLPFLHALAGLAIGEASRWGRAIALGLVLTGAICSALVTPNHLRYFNVLTKTVPRQGGLIGLGMIDSTLCWGRNTPALRRWLDEHPEYEIVTYAGNAMAEAHALLDLPTVFPRPYADEVAMLRARRRDATTRYCVVLDIKHVESAHGRRDDYTCRKPTAIIDQTLYLYDVTPDP